MWFWFSCSRFYQISILHQMGLMVGSYTILCIAGILCRDDAKVAFCWWTFLFPSVSRLFWHNTMYWQCTALVYVRRDRDFLFVLWWLIFFNFLDSVWGRVIVYFCIFPFYSFGSSTFHCAKVFCPGSWMSAFCFCDSQEVLSGILSWYINLTLGSRKIK